jgi:class 3 adenylate cyclase
MFSDLIGSTALSARMDPEDLRKVISAYQKGVAETVGRFGGFVAKYMGTPSFRVHQMSLSARKARHPDVSEVIVFGVVSRPSLDVVAGVEAAVEGA